MRIFILLLLGSFFLFSCNQKKEEPNNKKSFVVKGDTILTIKPEKTINTYDPVDVSPMDMSYFPADYPKIKMDKPDMNPPLARVVYSRPHLQGRKIFHDVLKYGEPWRLGANESTELDFYSDVTIQNKKIKAGRYILYAIPDQDKWTIVLNNNIDSWGLHQVPAKDIARFIITPGKINSSIEYFTMIFQQNTTGADLIMVWDNVEAKLPIVF